MTHHEAKKENVDMAEEKQQEAICAQCGICRICCLAADVAGESITTILSGESQTGAWICCNCWKCIDACPEDVDIYNLMIEKRHAEEPPPRYRDAFRQICSRGYIFPMEAVNTIREMWGLGRIRLVDPAKVRQLLSGCGKDACDRGDVEE